MPFPALAVPLLGAVTAAAVALPAAPGSTGVDVSRPQAGVALPASARYAVVGVDGATFGEPNPDLARQWAWASRLRGAPQLYVVAALRPGGAFWGKGGPHHCTGGTAAPVSAACAYDYGWVGARQSVAWARAAGLPRTRKVQWWVDVEGGASWVDDRPDLNAAAVRGIRDGLRSSGAASAVGLYVLATDWRTLVAPTAARARAARDLSALPVWAVGGAGSSLAKARARCRTASPTGGRVVQAQSPGRLGTTALDVDVVCAPGLDRPARLSRSGALALRGGALPGTRVTVRVAQHGRRTRTLRATAAASGTWTLHVRRLAPRSRASVHVVGGPTRSAPPAR